MRSNAVCILFLLLCFCAQAQPYAEANFRQYTSKDGLSNNYITAIEQDHYGYIWVATYKGLNRFDGSRFQQFYADSSAESLPRDCIDRLRRLDGERLGVLTTLGLHIINTRTLEQSNLLIPPPPGKKVGWLNRVLDATSDAQGNTFISSLAGFYQFDRNQRLVFRHDHALGPHRKAIFGASLALLNDTSLLVSSFDGLFRYNIRTHQLAPSDTTTAFDGAIAAIGGPLTLIRARDQSLFGLAARNNNELLLADIRGRKTYVVPAYFTVPEQFDGGMGAAVERLNDSVIAFNTRENGFYLLTQHAASAYTISRQPFFPHRVCTALFTDKHGRLWVGTDKGLFHAQKPGGRVEQVTLQQGALRNDILSMTVTRDRVFIGTSREGLLVYDKNDLHEVKRLDFSGYTVNEYPNMVIDMTVLPGDTMLTATAGLWVQTQTLQHGSLPLAAMDSGYRGIQFGFRDTRNNIYFKRILQNVFFVRSNNQFRRWDLQEALRPVGAVTGMAEDREGNLWFAGSGLMRFNTVRQAFDRVIDSFPHTRFRQRTVSSNIAFDSMGRLYFGVLDNGLMCYDPYTGQIKSITRNNGLPDNTIRALLFIGRQLWLGTESGLACYDLSSGSIRSFNAADGIPTDPFATYYLYYDAARRQLYGSFRSTFYRCYPDSLVKTITPPELYIESIGLPGNARLYHPGNDIRLSYADNNIIVNLAAINFENPYEQQFAYRVVETGGEPWQETGAQGNIIFSNLPPGDHRIQVKVYSRNASWPPQVQELRIHITTPFWKSVWFYAALVLLAVLVTVIFYRYRIRQIHRKANLDRMLAQTEMKALHAQMNPHFIFNCLNSIREMILNNDNVQASRYLSKFAQLIRMTLDQSAKSFISLKDTINYLYRYLEMEKIRTDTFDYSLDGDEHLDTEEIMIPPMLIQPFIENAIWHGRKDGEPMHIAINFRQEGDRLVCVIDDSGIGIEASLQQKTVLRREHTSVGIDSIRQRIRVLNEKYHTDCRLTIIDKSSLPEGGQGTIVTLQFPIHKYALS